jgi:hypothetical protein
MILSNSCPLFKFFYNLQHEILKYLNEKLIRLSSSKSNNDVLIWQHNEETVPLIRALTIAFERWNFDVFRVLTSEFVSLDTILVRDVFSISFSNTTSYCSNSLFFFYHTNVFFP